MKYEYKNLFSLCQTSYPYAVCIVLISMFFGLDLFMPDGMFIGGSDIYGSLYWNEMFVKQTVLSGSMPLWNPYYYSGHPFLANPSTFIFYPATLLYILLPLPLAFHLDTVFHFLIAAIGAYQFVYVITKSSSAGIASALVYSLSGYFIDRMFAGHLTLIHAAALIPWIFYCIERWFVTERRIFLALSGILLGMQILSGDPQVSLYTSIFLTLYYFMRATLFSDSVRSKKYLMYIQFIMIPLIAFGISAIQILPSLEFKLLSDRTNNTYDFATIMSFSLRHFFLFLVPKAQTAQLNTNWEFGCYLGILSIVLAGIGGIFSQHRKQAICLGIMLVVALSFILGSSSPVYYLYYKYLPLISTFRVPARGLVVFDFIMSILVGLGFHHICVGTFKRAQYLLGTAALFVILAVLFLGSRTLNIPLDSRQMLAALVLTVSGGVMLYVSYMYRNKVTTMLLILLIFADLFIVQSSFVPKLNSSKLEEKQSYEHIFESDPDFFRVNIPGYREELYGFPNRGMMNRYYCINASTPIILGDYFHFVYSMANAPKPGLSRYSFSQDLFQVNTAFSSRILGVKYAIVETPTGYVMKGVKEYFPRANLVRDIVFTHEYKDQLNILKNPEFDPRKSVLLDESARDSIAQEAEKVSNEKDWVTIERYSPNRIELKSNSPNSTILVLSELFYPGWHAFVDGQQQPILRADYLLRAIPLSPGKHAIEIVYRPMSLQIGAGITVLTIILIGAYFIMTRRRIYS